jgi:uncharacterized protein (DUF488 family)
MPSRPPRTILTIGHSNHSAERLLELLDAHAVSLVVDVRSVPSSGRFPHFGRKPLMALLKAHGIQYLFLGRELGGRGREPSCYENGKVSYRKLARSAGFWRGLERVVAEADANQVALLCAEREPLACHRALLVARELDDLGVNVEHIHADGHRESHADAVRRLLALLKMPEADLFAPRTR